MGGREAGLGDRLGHDGDSAGECLDRAGAGLGGVHVLADGDQPRVARGGDGFLAEAVDGDAVQATGVADDQAVTAEPDLDGEPGGPGIEVAVDDRVGDQLPEGNEGIDEAVADGAVRLVDDVGVEGAPRPGHRLVEHAGHGAVDRDLVARPGSRGLTGRGLGGCLDDEPREPLLRVEAEREDAGHGRPPAGVNTNVHRDLYICCTFLAGASRVPLPSTTVPRRSMF